MDIFFVVSGEEAEKSKIFVVSSLISLSNIFWFGFKIGNIGNLNRLHKFGYNEKGWEVQGLS